MKGIMLESISNLHRKKKKQEWKSVNEQEGEIISWVDHTEINDKIMTKQVTKIDFVI